MADSRSHNFEFGHEFFFSLQRLRDAYHAKIMFETSCILLDAFLRRLLIEDPI